MFGITLPKWVLYSCVLATIISTTISIYSQSMQILNYRVPSQQRLILRIQILVPIFSISTLVSVVAPNIANIYTDPIREIYEALVIYQFFSYLTIRLGGERNIIVNIAPKYPALKHAIPIFGSLMPLIDLSDPHDFGMLKKGVLQYVWFKPLYCIGLIICELLNFRSLWLDLIYNVSVTWSLYCLAMFWRCLYDELSRFKPWPKFMCVKIIIFASYWQSMLIDGLSYFGVIERGGQEDKSTGYFIRNAVLCIEMVGFAFAHLYAFPSKEYGLSNYPNAGRLKVWYAIRDFVGFKDLLWDFKSVWNGDYNNYRSFDSVESMLSDRDTHSRTNRLTRGLRYTDSGKTSYWVQGSGNTPRYGSFSSTERPVSNQYSPIFEEPWIEITEGLSLPRYIPEDKNYPILWDPESHRYDAKINELRNQLRSA